MKAVFLIPILFFGFLGQAQISWNIDSLGLYQDPLVTVPGKFDTYNEVWGFHINGGNYGVIGSKQGTYIVNISNPSQPELVKFVPGTHDNAINRDYHDYNGYLYMVCDQGPSTLQILDLHYLPDSVSLIYQSDSLFARCHNIFIDSTSAKMYACAVKTVTNNTYDMVIYDLSQGPIPVESLIFDDPFLDDFHDIYVRHDTAFANRGNSGLYIYDFSGPNWKYLSSIPSYPQQGYNHAGYVYQHAPYYYFSDETKGKDLKVVDISNLNDPEVVGLFNSGRHARYIVAHNILIRDHLLMVSYYHEGLQVYSLADPSKPELIAYYHTYNTWTEDSEGHEVIDYTGFRGAWGVYPFLPGKEILVSDREKGLFILRMAEHNPAKEIRTFYPNPFQTGGLIAFPTKEIFHIDLYDETGRLVQKHVPFIESGPSTLVNINSSLIPGIYFMKVSAVKETFTIKAIKE